MDLVVIRHAIAEERDAFARTGKPDDLRPLTAEGIEQMERGMRGLRRVQSDLDVLASSPLTRAQQTAAIVAREYGMGETITTDVLRPDAAFDDFVGWAYSLDSDDVVAIVGHEPHLSALVSWLLAGGDDAEIELKKGSACLLSFEGTPRRGEGELRWLLTPKELRAMAK
ncbi:MAG TPA: histidine phosphatase family protein [Gemmatimonadaceae bacterium]|nr:histidine phosphatase family protein [Gemmatimonadaceae bacterium]